MSAMIVEEPVRSAHSSTRHAAMNSAALAMLALGSGIQVALYLRAFGATHRTDGLIAAFAVYSLIVVLGQLLRTTAVGLLSGSRPVMTSAEFGWAIALIALVATACCAALSHPLGNTIARSAGPQGRATAQSALLIMAPAIGLQFAAAGLAVSGAASDRLDRVAFAFMASPIAGLVSFFVLRGPAAELVLAWTILIASAALACCLVLSIGVRIERPPALRALLSAAFALVRSILVPASFIVMYPLSLALAPRSQPGQVTLFGLAYTACSYLAGFTGQALSMSDAIAFARLGPDALAERRGLVIRAFRYSLLLAAPGLAVAAIAGAPIVRALLPADSKGSNSYFATYTLLLIPWLVATLGVWATMPALLSRTRGGGDSRLATGVGALLVIHVAAALVGRAVAGFDGLVVAMALAPVIFVVVGLRITAPGAVTDLARTTMTIGVAAAVGFGVARLALWAVAGSTPATGIGAALVGAGLYVMLARLAYPDAARTFVGLVIRS